MECDIKETQEKVPFTKQGWSLGANCLRCLGLINKIHSRSESLYERKFTHHSLPILILFLAPMQTQTPSVLNSREIRASSRFHFSLQGKNNQACISLQIRARGVFSERNQAKKHCNGSTSIFNVFLPLVSHWEYCLHRAVTYGAGNDRPKPYALLCQVNPD